MEIHVVKVVDTWVLSLTVVEHTIEGLLDHRPALPGPVIVRHTTKHDLRIGIDSLDGRVERDQQIDVQLGSVAKSPPQLCIEQVTVVLLVVELPVLDVVRGRTVALNGGACTNSTISLTS